MKNSEKKTVADAGNAKAAEAVEAIKKNKNACGTVHIHENVIAALVRKAALEQPGVSRLAGNSLVDNIAEIVGSRRIQSRAILVAMGEDNTLAIEVKINVCFGCKVHEVATCVQKAVAKAVEDATGMTVTSVNVSVEEIEDPAELADEDEEEEAPADEQ